MYRTLYLNNTGSRWIHVDESGNKEKVRVLLPNGNIEERTALFYEAFGNFASVTISYKGQKMSVLADEHTDGKAIIDIQKWLDLKAKREAKSNA